MENKIKNKELIDESIEKFINDTRCTYEREGIILENGIVVYASPSHTEKLVRISEIDQDIIYYELMPIYASPIMWLTYFVNCLPIWNNGYGMTDKATDEQKYTLSVLFEKKAIKDDVFFYATKENCKVLQNTERECDVNKLNKEICKCKICGWEFPYICRRTSIFSIEEKTIRYCPSCGAKIMNIKQEKKIEEFYRLDDEE